MKFIFPVPCYLFFIIYSQNISGTITDSNNQKIANATLLFKESQFKFYQRI
jgi:hypothetical protein